MSQHNFGPAQPGEATVFGAQRPGYDCKSVPQGPAKEWVAFMKKKAIRRVCCLLPEKQLAYYRGDLLAEYREEFGQENVINVQVEDYHLCGADDFDYKILPFLRHSDAARSPVVVHCSGGSGRTGHVLAAWLVRDRGLSINDAIEAVKAAGRNPLEAIYSKNATRQQLESLLAG